MLSTHHKAIYIVLDKQRHGGNVIKPTPVVNFSQNMGGIDLSDQMLQYYETLRRTVIVLLK